MRMVLQFLVIALVLATLAWALRSRTRKTGDHQPPEASADPSGISNGLLLAWVLTGSLLAMLFLALLDHLLG